MFEPEETCWIDLFDELAGYFEEELSCHWQAALFKWPSFEPYLPNTEAAHQVGYPQARILVTGNDPSMVFAVTVASENIQVQRGN